MRACMIAVEFLVSAHGFLNITHNFGSHAWALTRDINHNMYKICTHVATHIPGVQLPLWYICMSKYGTTTVTTGYTPGGATQYRVHVHHVHAHT